ncbi:MAG: transglutaminase family protein [Verrucomicrobiota bacterium JB023]|nr:transglutaminase family protein [Verrucomicrobiota bacterium JB023]
MSQKQSQGGSQSQSQSQTTGQQEGRETKRLTINHRTRYAYRFPVQLQPHRLVLRPREGHDLKVLEHQLTISPAAECVWSRDIFGNSITRAHFPEEKVEELVIESHLVIERSVVARDPSVKMVQAENFEIAYDLMEQAVVNAYLKPVYPEETEAMQNWFAQLPHLNDFAGFHDYLEALCSEVHRRIDYRRRDEKGVQSPLTTINLGSGSCRDMATLMMETLRMQGLAARFASGYLDCQATRAARGSTHAWTEAYLPELGWVGYDPTAGRACGLQHVVIGTSHHPRGVMPISGKFFGPSNAFSGLSVAVQFA